VETAITSVSSYRTVNARISAHSRISGPLFHGNLKHKTLKRINVQATVLIVIE